jgi:hypothetical protein
VSLLVLSATLLALDVYRALTIGLQAFSIAASVLFLHVWLVAILTRALVATRARSRT